MQNQVEATLSGELEIPCQVRAEAPGPWPNEPDAYVHRCDRLCEEKQTQATLPRLTENISAGCAHTVSATTVCQQKHTERYYRRAAAYKLLITKINAHSRVECWQK